jgi:hypothetical protein
LVVPSEYDTLNGAVPVNVNVKVLLPPEHKVPGEELMDAVGVGFTITKKLPEPATEHPFASVTVPLSV